ncbi:MAG: hypothetical protein L0I76_16400 [Pseudonocardia sp.]|nr:hypothetical protein [Pseudonocardia sp.]
MLFLFVLLGAAIFAVVLWRTLKSEQMVSDPSPRPELPWGGTARPARPRASGPDDDPEFLKQLDEKVRGNEDPPTST